MVHMIQIEAVEGRPPATAILGQILLLGLSDPIRGCDVTG